MNRFNLSFNGEIQPGFDPGQVKARFGKLFGIDDPVRLERFFTGDTIILRRNLDRKTAAEYYSKLRKLGVESQLIKVTAKEAASALAPAAISSAPEQAPKTSKKPDDKAAQRVAWEKARREAEQEAVNRRAEEELARKKKAEEEGRRKAREEEARRKAEQEARHRAEEQAALRKAREEEARRKAEEEAALRKAREEEARRKAEEQAALRKAREEEARRKAEEEAALRKAREEEARRKAEEEARRKAEEEAARRKALKEEAARRKAEERARKAAEAEKRRAAREQEKKKAAEAAARREAERAEQRRLKEEEARRERAAREEARRQAAEIAARRKAEKEAARKKAREEAAQRRAEEQARKQEAENKRRAEQEEARLRAAEIAAQKAAEKAEKQRARAEEIARKKAAEAEARRAAREEAERKRAEEAEKAAQERARRKTEREAATRREIEAREHARQQQAAQRAQEEAARQEQEAHRKAMEEQAIDRAARELSHRQAQGGAARAVRTSLDLPRSRKPTIAHGRQRQAWAPNLYSLRPFRATPEVKSRVEVAQQATRRHFVLAGALLLLTLCIGTIYLKRPLTAPLSGPSAAAVPPGEGPTLLAGHLLLRHDRAGNPQGQINIDQMGVSHLEGRMLFTQEGDLLMLGQMAGKAKTENAGISLLRCQTNAAVCQPITTPWSGETIGAFAHHTLDGSLFLLNSRNGKLVRVDAQGEVVGSAEIRAPLHPVMRLNSGLLFINSSAGPAISVFRYDSNAFGKQLDEILLLPPPAVAAEQQLVTDFLWNAGSWWVTLANPDTGSAGVYRFDKDWNYLGQLSLQRHTNPAQLIAWGEKTLLRDPLRASLQRFNSAGEAEVPLESPPLTELVERSGQFHRLQQAGWHAALLAVALAAVAALCLGWLQATRALVYRGRKAQGAQPIDDLADNIQWIPPDSGRQVFFKRINIGYGIIAASSMLIAIGAGISAMSLAALLLILGGAATSLMLLQRSPIGHVGVVDGQLLLVDHSLLYHIGCDARLQHRGPFLLIDDVTVFTGNSIFPAFTRESIDNNVAPLVEGGARVDRKTVIVKLAQARHPLARAFSWFTAACLLAGLLLLLQWW